MFKLLLAICMIGAFSLADQYQLDISSTQFPGGAYTGSVNISTPPTITSQNDINIFIGANKSGTYGRAGNINLTPGLYGAVNINGNINFLNQPTPNMLQLSATVNNYSQLYIQNKSNGTSASTEFVAGNDKSSPTGNYYGTFGINSSTYSNASYDAEGANDAFMYASDGNLVLESATTNGVIKLVTGGATSNNIRATVSSGGLNVNGTVSASALQVNGTVSASALQVNGAGMFSSPVVENPNVANDVLTIKATDTTLTINRLMGIKFQDDTADTAYIRSLRDNKPSNYNSELLFYTNQGGAPILAMGERMRIDNNGNVGIGTTAPSTKLEVAGTVSQNSIVVGGSNGTVAFNGTGIATANSTTACLFTATSGPAGANTSIQGWIKINVNGTVRFLPYW